VPPAVFKTVCGALLRRPGWVRFPSIPAKFPGGDSQEGLLPKAPSEVGGDKHGAQKLGNRCARPIESTSRCEAER
jgi:hypothetical protein